MHIVHVMTRMLRAGSEENILLTAAGQLAEGDEVTLVYGDHSSTALADRLVPSARCVQISSMVHPISPANDWKAYREMSKVFRDLGPEVVHTHQSKAGILGRYAAAAADVPCVVHGVHLLPFIGVGGLKRRIYLGAERAAARTTHGYIHVSQGMLDGCRDNAVGPAVPHIIVHSGFDLQRFRDAQPPDDWRQLLGVDDTAEKPLTFTMLAALEPRKRHLELMDVLPSVVARHPDVRFLFAGEGALHDEITQKAGNLGIEDNVCLTGYREDPERIIALSDVCLLASGQEGLPRSVLQYLVAGKPTVMFDLQGLDEIMADGVNGRIIPSDDWLAYADAMVQLADDPALRERLAVAAGESDLSDWDWRSMGTKSTNFYRSLPGTRLAH